MSAEEKKEEKKPTGSAAAVPKLEHFDTQFGKVEQAVASGLGGLKANNLDLSPENLVNIPMDSIPVNVTLPCPIYIKVAGKVSVFRAKGERLTSKRAFSLAGRGVLNLSIHKTNWETFLENLADLKLPEPVTPESASQHLRGLLTTFGLELERMIREPKRPLFDKLQKLCDSLAAVIRSNPVLGTQLLRKGDGSLITHNVNIAIYSGVIGYKVGFNLDDMRTLIFAGLTHDLGKLLLPKGLVFKAADFDADEKAVMETHTREGAEVLQTMGCSPPVVLTALQHHERMDGKGYPSKLEAKQIHPFARICAIADAYDTLTSPRPGRDAFSPGEALGKMRAADGKFDMTYLVTAVTGK